jgi:hypothetical protein
MVMHRLTRWNDKTEMAELLDWDTEEEWKEFIDSLDVPIQVSLCEAFDKLAEYEDLEEQGRLKKLSIADINPCPACTKGFGYISDGGAKFCYDDCDKFKQYEAMRIKEKQLKKLQEDL